MIKGHKQLNISQTLIKTFNTKKYPTLEINLLIGIIDKYVTKHLLACLKNQSYTFNQLEIKLMIHSRERNHMIKQCISLIIWLIIKKGRFIHASTVTTMNRDRYQKQKLRMCLSKK